MPLGNDEDGSQVEPEAYAAYDRLDDGALAFDFNYYVALKAADEPTVRAAIMEACS